MKYLIWLGIKESESYDIIKKIAKKKFKEKELKDLKERLHDNWKKVVGREEGFNETWTVVNDAARYSFNASHSLSYAYDSLYGAFLKAHYPLAYYTTALNNYDGDEERTIKLTDEIKHFNIKIKQPKFRYSKSNYVMDKQTNSIYKGISSIKYLNTQVGELLYSLRDNQYNSFVDLLIDINKKINRRQMEILIKLDYFAEFGKSYKLMQTYELFNNIYGKKQLRKDKYPHLNEYFSKYCTTETAAMYKFDDTTELLKDIIKDIPNENINIVERVMSWKEYVGNCSLIDKTNPRDCVVTDVDLKYTPRVEMYCLGSGNTQWVKISKRIWKNNKLQKGDLVNLCEVHKKHKRKKVGDKWVELEDFELWTDEYFVK